MHQGRVVGGLLYGRVQQLIINAESFADGLAQGLADPLIQLLRLGFAEARVPGQGGAQTRDAARLIHQAPHRGVRDQGGAVGRQRRHGHGVAAIYDGVRNNARQVRTAGDGDLMLQGRLNQDADQVCVLQQGTGGEDRRCDLDLVQRQHVDQGGRRPVDLRQSLGQDFSHIPLSLTRQGQEDFTEHRSSVAPGR